ncbi:cation-transporting P-type ATPase [Mesorhizobium soli]|uniref:cation-transporting P-type ATPase n=1 Tax=Pseudaminobacter soli (ex Li et al. 2025) TaxID=1295366 RepID=UPI0011B1EC24
MPSCARTRRQIWSNTVGQASRSTALAAFARQFRSPLVLILMFAAKMPTIVAGSTRPPLSMR